MDIKSKYKRALDLEAKLNRLTGEIWLELEKHGRLCLREFQNLKREVELQYFEGQTIEPPGLIPAGVRVLDIYGVPLYCEHERAAILRACVVTDEMRQKASGL